MYGTSAGYYYVVFPSTSMALMERPILDELVRFLIRLFRYKGAIVGNAHLDALALETTPEAVRLHRPFHDVGRDLVVGLFVRNGYDV